MKSRIELANSLGADMQVSTREEENVEVCEFAGNLLLAEYDSAGPFKGFSIVPYCYDVDEETGTAYGLVRNLFDPQMELNKSKSLEIEYLAQSTAPGVTAEEDSITDRDQFSDELRRAGGIAIVKKNALSEGRVVDRVPSPPSQAVMSRMQGAMDLLNEVSTIPSAANLTAGEQMQAGVTVSLRYNKARQSVSDPFAHHELAQKQVVEKVCQAIVSSMPESQMNAILGKGGQYVIENGRVIELTDNPQAGQPQQPGMPQQPAKVPKAMANIRDLRTMKWSLDMEFTSENSTLRQLELGVLMQLVQANVPVDPEVLVERATNSRSVRERLKAYVEKAQRAQSEGQSAEAAAMQQQNQQFAQIEMAKVQENQRHNQMTERLTEQDNQIKAKLKHLEIWEKADENEKARMMDMARFAIESQNRQRQAANGGMR